MVTKTGSILHSLTHLLFRCPYSQVGEIITCRQTMPIMEQGNYFSTNLSGAASWFHLIGTTYLLSLTSYNSIPTGELDFLCYKFCIYRLAIFFQQITVMNKWLEQLFGSSFNLAVTLVCWINAPWMETDSQVGPGNVEEHHRSLSVVFADFSPIFTCTWLQLYCLIWYTVL